MSDRILRIGSFLRGLWLILLSSAATTAAGGAISHSSFGKLPNGSEVTIYTLKNEKLEMRVMTFGARVVSLKAPDANGKMANVVLGYDNLEDYVSDNKNYFGAALGRFANRIANGMFRIEGREYHLTENEGTNTLHGGKEGFDRRNWMAKEVPNGVEFTLVSPDGDQGFPGTLVTHVRYTLHENTISIRYTARTDMPTVINLTNHAYFNLSGVGSGTITSERLTLYAAEFTPVDSNLIPTGKVEPVAGTPFDFTHNETIGARIDSDNEQLKLAHGYDQNWVLNGAIGKLHTAARVFDPVSGRILEEATTEPGVQFYTGNFLPTASSQTTSKYTFRSGFCLETQHFPDSPNHSSFPSTELKPNHIYSSQTNWTFRAR